MIIGLVLGMMIGSATVAAAAPGAVQAVITKLTFSVDGQNKNLKSTPLVYNGTTYLPVREVSGMLGYDLDFNSKSGKIDFKTKGDIPMANTNIDTKTTISLREVVEILNAKYPDKKSSLAADGTLYFGEKIFKLSLIHNKVDVQQLIDLKLIEEEDL